MESLVRCRKPLGAPWVRCMHSGQKYALGVGREGGWVDGRV